MLFGFIVVVIIVIGVMAAIGSDKEKKRLKQVYDDALRGNDKRTALNAGRAYYSSLRGGKQLTIYDEQAITNDLSAMRNA